MGAVLYQVLSKNKKNIISYANAKFKQAETNYYSNEQECLAAVWAVRRYRVLLEFEHFTLKTDNAALTWLHQLKDLKAKLIRWALVLQKFNFDIEHCPGRENGLPDALSRNPADTYFHLPEEEKMSPPQTSAVDEPAICSMKVDTLSQQQDPEVINWAKRLERPIKEGPQNRADEEFLNTHHF